MKSGKRINLLIESVILNGYTHHLYLLSIGEYSKQKDTAEPFSTLVRKTEKEDKTELIKWIERYAPLRYNNKKRRFVKVDEKSWDLNSAVTEGLLISQESINELHDKYGFWKGKDVDATQTQIANRLQQIESQLGTFTEPFSPQEVADFEPAISKITNKKDREAIRAYLAKHPHSVEAGKFGLPQSKQRYGTYGAYPPDHFSWSK